MNSIEKTPFSSVRQMGLLTGNLDRFIDNMKKLYSLEPDRTAFYPKESSPSDCQRKIAFYNFPEIELEVIEPTNSHKSFHEFLAKHGDCMHHVQFNVDNLAAAMKKMEDAGANLIERGFSITDPRVEFLFYDTVGQLGYVTEIVNFREFE